MQGVAAMLALGLVVVIAACGSSSKSSKTTSSVPSGQPGSGKPAVTIGDKNFTE